MLPVFLSSTSEIQIVRRLLNLPIPIEGFPMIESADPKVIAIMKRRRRMKP